MDAMHMTPLVYDNGIAAMAGTAAKVQNISVNGIKRSTLNEEPFPWENGWIILVVAKLKR